jgi:hypothetical protein
MRLAVREAAGVTPDPDFLRAVSMAQFRNSLRGSDEQA